MSFYQDSKIIGWASIHFFEADDDQQATQRLAEVADAVMGHDGTEYLQVSDRDFLLNNIRDLTVAENEDRTTVETFDHRQHILLIMPTKPLGRETLVLNEPRN